MRSTEEMMQMILGTALEDKRIRAVYMEGSRANPQVKRDIFQDFDIVYVVEDTVPFIHDRKWIDRFGERLYMQYPEDSVYAACDRSSCYGWLIQFKDGNRLDLHVCTRQHAQKQLQNEGMYIILSDKDNCLPPCPSPSDRQYWIQKPSQAQFHDTCNEFYWCLNNVAKGLWRDELPYVMEMLDFCIRPMLTRMLEWKIGIAHDFSVSVGKSAKYMKKFLCAEVYAQYLSTYSICETEEIWNAVLRMCDLFETVAREVAKKLSLHFDSTEAQNSRYYLTHIRALPPDAKSVL